MNKVYERATSGRTGEGIEPTTSVISQKEGLDEINGCMMGGRQRQVLRMSSISRTDYHIVYRTGEVVVLKLVDAPQPEPQAAQTGDRIEPRDERTAFATLADGRVFIVNTRISRKHPKNEFGMTCLADNTSYYSSRNGKPFGATRTTSETSKPKSVGGRIWALLTSYGTGA